MSPIILKKLESEELCKVYVNCKSFLKKKHVFKIKKKFFLDAKKLIAINNILIKECFSSYLITKISLYTKVKFYLGLIKTVLCKDMQILILVPYIKNINIIKCLLKNYFNVSIDTVHSQLTNSRYLKNWIKTKNGENSIVIGTRKSVFFPFLKLGVIIILEEHDLNYKNSNQFRYNVRDMAILRAYKENVPIILDSDTPSLKTLHNILLKKCFYIKLCKYNYFYRLNNIIVDLKKDKIKFGLSLTLINEIYNNFKNKQVLLIFNKTNLSIFVLSCTRCGWIFKCSNCSDYFEINEHHNILLCKFCLIKIKKPIFCYNCRYLSLNIMNISIEKIKNKIQNIFPKMPLFFLLNKRHMLNKKNFEFSILSPCIIITNEEIVKNYYFPNVRLISLICIDSYFLSFQFQTIEYFAQFYINLTKLIRNRSTLLKVLIQTSFSNDLNLNELCNYGYFYFAKKTLETRKKFLLPPWSFQSIIYTESKNTENNVIFLNIIRKIFKKKSKKYNCSLWLIGPHFSFLSNNKKKIHQLFIQCSSRIFLNNLLNECIYTINFFSISKRVKWFVDTDPN